jgi:glutathionylspermidine synthase
MINLTKVKPASQFVMDGVGYSWDNCFTEVVNMTEGEIDELYSATNSLYSFYQSAGELVIKNNLFDQFGITNPKIIKVIKKEWEDEKFRHIWGRFDFAGGTSNLPIKLIEFNADTATAIVETAVLQHAVTITNEMDTDYLFNDVYESLIESFKQLQQNWNLPEEISIAAFSLDTEEDNRTIDFLVECALSAGLSAEVVNIESLMFDKDGCFRQNMGGGVIKTYNVILKLVPWEMLLEHEPEFTDILCDLILADKLVVLNPTYTLIFQSKYMLKFLSELYPESPYILKCSDAPLKGKHVSKPIFGREGANVKIVDVDNKYSKMVYEEDGDYGNQPMIYQEFAEFDKDAKGNIYQVGSFMCDDACGIAYRRSSTPVIVNTSEFVGHYNFGR